MLLESSTYWSHRLHKPTSLYFIMRVYEPYTGKEAKTIREKIFFTIVWTGVWICLGKCRCIGLIPYDAVQYTLYLKVDTVPAEPRKDEGADDYHMPYGLTLTLLTPEVIQCTT